MVISARKVYIPLFIVVLLLQLYLPSFKANIFIQLLVLIMLLIIDRASFSRAYLRHLSPFAALLLLGFAGTLIHKYNFYNIVKDIFHFIKPVVGLLIGYLFFKRINDFKIFAKTIIAASLISAIIHFIIIAFLVKFKAGSITEIREFTRDNFLELLGLLFLLFYKKFYGYRLINNRLYHFIVMVLILISVTLYFSRTMIVAAIFLTASVYGYTKLTRKSLKVIGILFFTITILYMYLYNTNIRRDKPGIEAFLYKVKIAPAEIFKTNINRDNHKDLWDHWRGYEAKRAYSLMTENPSSFVFGTGHGSLVNLKFFAPLTGERKGIRYISELHNGYMYIFYKTGFIGLFIYLFILLRWYLLIYVYSNKNFIIVLISGISIVYLFSTLTITGMYNNKDIFILIMGALLFYYKLQPQKNDKNINQDLG